LLRLGLAGTTGIIWTFWLKKQTYHLSSKFYKIKKYKLQIKETLPFESLICNL
jgi:hypothetical protein